MPCLHQAYIKDTYNFINCIKNTQVTEEYLLVTADVTSLYTNMYINTTISKLRSQFNLYPNPARPDYVIIELIKQICHNNDFRYNGDFYLQHRGFEMGVRFSPGMVNVYLIDFDAKAISYVINPISYRRFLEDVFFVWPGSIEQLTAFQDYLNTLEPGIHVTFSYHKTNINFLDVIVFKHIKNNGLITLQTMPYFKPTDSHQLLQKKFVSSTSHYSRHPQITTFKVQTPVIFS